MGALHSPRNTELVIKQLHSVKSQVKTVRFQSSPEGCSLLNYWYIQGGPKMAQFFWYALTSSNINRFSKLFYCQNQEKMCNNTINKDPTTLQVCCYTTL